MYIIKPKNLWLVSGKKSKRKIIVQFFDGKENGEILLGIRQADRLARMLRSSIERRKKLRGEKG